MKNGICSKCGEREVYMRRDGYPEFYAQNEGKRRQIPEVFKKVN